MEEFIEKIKAHKELWFIVPILMYVISFVLEYTYYQSFDLNIVPYISPLGLIFSFASLFIGFFIVGCMHLVTGLMIKFALSESKYKDQSFLSLMFPGVLILYLVQRYCELSIHTKEIIMNYIIMFMMVFVFLSFKQLRENFAFMLGMIFVMICSFVINFNGGRTHYNMWGGLNAVCFNYNGKYVHSNSTDKVYIGETTDFLFLHDKYKKETKVYKKSNIDSLVILPPCMTLTNGMIIHNQNYEIEDIKRRWRLKQLTHDDSTYLKLRPKTKNLIQSNKTSSDRPSKAH